MYVNYFPDGAYRPTMDLNYTPEYEAFRAELRDFLESNRDKWPKRLSIVPTDEMKTWQQMLIERGYTARTIPKEYGGYGAAPDVLKSRIIAEEFTATGAMSGLAGQPPC